MEKIEKIKERLKNEYELEEEFERLVNKPRQRNEIYIYCIKRERLNGDINYIPLISSFNGERFLMACNDVKTLQEDYKKDILKLELAGIPIIIIEVQFDIYVELSRHIEKIINFSPQTYSDIIKRTKTELLLQGMSLSKKDFPSEVYIKIKNEKNYCKCLDEKLNIVECGNYKPLKC